MAIKKKQHKVKMLPYTCTFCRTKSNNGEVIRRCEAAHTCQHKKRYEFYGDGDWDSHQEFFGVQLHCKPCKVIFEVRGFSNVNNNQKIMKNIFNALSSSKGDINYGK